MAGRMTLATRRGTIVKLTCAPHSPLVAGSQPPFASGRVVARMPGASTSSVRRRPGPTAKIPLLPASPQNSGAPRTRTSARSVADYAGSRSGSHRFAIIRTQTNTRCHTGLHRVGLLFPLHFQRPQKGRDAIPGDRKMVLGTTSRFAAGGLLKPSCVDQTPMPLGRE